MIRVLAAQAHAFRPQQGVYGSGSHQFEKRSARVRATHPPDRRNLEFIEDGAARQAQVHVVTQLTLSLLGLVVFPKEKLLPRRDGEEDARRNGERRLATWTITRDDGKKPTNTLADILKHLRNAVAHGRLIFTSDSPRVEEVAIIVEDKKRREDPEPYWCARIEAQDLRTFCLRFLDFIEETIG